MNIKIPISKTTKSKTTKSKTNEVKAAKINSAKIKTAVLTCIFSILLVLNGCAGSTKFNGNNPGSTINKGTESTTTGDNATQATETQPTGGQTTVSEADTTETGSTEGTGNGGNKGTEAPAVKVKALYLTGWTAGSGSRLKHFVELANNTEINSYVIDIKDDDGYVGYESSIPEVREVGGWKSKYNADKVLKTMHENNIHVIGRLVCFKDPVLSSKKTEFAVKNTSGGLWKDNNNLTWLNPYNKESWDYIIKIAKEAVDKGFDEIQFDYVRFPNDGNRKNQSFGKVDKEKYEIINEFLAYAKKELPETKISADVFGIICESPADSEGIGQYLELIGKDIDYISPMVYPSHYALGQVVNNVKFSKPDFKPYEVVYNSLVKARDRIAKAGSYKATVRPYLQDFTATWLKEGNYMTYGATQVRQQIKAVYDAGYDEWILWDAKNTYSEDAFKKE